MTAVSPTTSDAAIPLLSGRARLAPDNCCIVSERRALDHRGTRSAAPRETRPSLRIRRSGRRSWCGQERVAAAFRHEAIRRSAPLEQNPAPSVDAIARVAPANSSAAAAVSERSRQRSRLVAGCSTPRSANSLSAPRRRGVALSPAQSAAGQLGLYGVIIRRQRVRGSCAWRLAIASSADRARRRPRHAAGIVLGFARRMPRS